MAGFCAGTTLRRMIALSILALVAGGSLVAGALVGQEGGSRSRPVPEASAGRPVERTSFLAKIVPPEPERTKPSGPRVPRSISDLARRLPLERKVAQLLLVGFSGQNLTATVYQRLRRLDLGGIVLDRPNYTGVQLLGQMAGEARVISQQEKHVPPWVMAPQEGGERNAFPDLPPRDAPGDLSSVAAAASEAEQASSALRPLGITGILGPDIDVGLEDDPFGPRIYSDSAGEVAAFAAATVRAYVHGDLFTAVGHFPGLGTASQPTEEGPAQVGLSPGELLRRDLVPFRAAFRAGAPAVVLSHALYSLDNFTTPGSLSKRVVTGLLRRRMHFGGVAITDDLADPAVTSAYSVPEAAVRAIRAGADMVWISGPDGDQQAAYVAILRAVRRGAISRRRLDQAVVRILSAKRRLGLIR